ncbi:MAG: hypothetical protein ACK5H1_00725 [Tenacibaculum sp.]
MIFLYLVEKLTFLELFFWMFGSFLIGYLFSWLKLRNNKKQPIKVKKNNQLDSHLEIDKQHVIKAIKTVERGGIEVKHPRELTFDNIGIAKPENKDDLTQINGIGSVVEKKLNNIGIYTYSQISKLSKEEIEAVTSLIQFFPGRIVRDNWKEQASNLQKNKVE